MPRPGPGGGAASRLPGAKWRRRSRPGRRPPALTCPPEPPGGPQIAQAHVCEGCGPLEHQEGPLRRDEGGYWVVHNCSGRAQLNSRHEGRSSVLDCLVKRNALNEGACGPPDRASGHCRDARGAVGWVGCVLEAEVWGVIVDGPPPSDGGPLQRAWTAPHTHLLRGQTRRPLPNAPENTLGAAHMCVPHETPWASKVQVLLHLSQRHHAHCVSDPAHTGMLTRPHTPDGIGKCGPEADPRFDLLRARAGVLRPAERTREPEHARTGRSTGRPAQHTALPPARPRRASPAASYVQT
jgi:hypothetical protein